MGNYGYGLCCFSNGCIDSSLVGNCWQQELNLRINDSDVRLGRHAGQNVRQFDVRKMTQGTSPSYLVDGVGRLVRARSDQQDRLVRLCQTSLLRGKNVSSPRNLVKVGWRHEPFCGNCTKILRSVVASASNDSVSVDKHAKRRIDVSGKVW